MSLIPETDARHLHTAAIHLYNAAIAEQDRAETLTRPSYMLKPALSLDGNKWCALYGDNLQDGVAGFGDTPALAYADFDKAWVSPVRLTKKADGETKQCPECGHETIFVRPMPHKCRCGYSFIG